MLLSLTSQPLSAQQGRRSRSAAHCRAPGSRARLPCRAAAGGEGADAGPSARDAADNVAVELPPLKQASRCGHIAWGGEDVTRQHCGSILALGGGGGRPPAAYLHGARCVPATCLAFPATLPVPTSPLQVPYRAIAALAAAGLADSAYLTAVKVLSLTPACPLSGGGTGASCGDILTSEYSTLFGVVPLAAVGMLAYGGMAALALAGAAAASGSSAASAPASAAAAAQAAAASGEAPAAAEGESAAAGAGAAAAAPAAERSAAQAAEEAPYRRAVLAGGLAMATCSSCLLYIMLTKFGGALCPWCLASAALSFGIAALAASGLRPRELSEAAAPGAGAVATTLLLLSLGLGTPNLSFASGGYDLDYSLPEVTSASGPDAVSLAERLAAAGARMYGAFWCSHCYDQKQAFGAEAMAAFPYVECYPEGLHKARPCPAT